MKIARRCLFMLILGTVSGQAGCFILGLMVLSTVARVRPDLGISEGEIAAPTPLTIFGFGLLGFAIVRGREYFHMLRTGYRISGRVSRVEVDGSGDEYIYPTVLEYQDAEGKVRRVETTRRSNDLIVGDEVPLLIDATGKTAILERDLAGGTTFSNVYGLTPIPIICWIRVLMVPALSLVPFVALLPRVSMLYERATALVGAPLAYQWPLAVQVIWLFKNRRHFMFKDIDLCCRSGQACEISDK